MIISFRGFRLPLFSWYFHIDVFGLMREWNQYAAHSWSSSNEHLVTLPLLHSQVIRYADSYNEHGH
jgi:hypothetical protein